MSATTRCKLVDYLYELTDEEFKRFKLHLEDYPLDEGYKPIRHAKTENADQTDIARLMVGAYEETKALQMAIKIFDKIHRKELSVKVQKEMSEVFLQPTKPAPLTKEERKRKDELMNANLYAKFFETPKKVEVTLDPKTAFPTLILSEDRKSVHLGSKAQSLPDNPERFSYLTCVLGAQGINTGTLEWVVEVGEGKGWAIGVARESIERKGFQYISVIQGFWVLKLEHGEYKASSSPPTVLPLWKSPQRIKIHLNHDFDTLSFYDADSGEHIFTFNYPFTEKMFPFFQVGDTESPLKICPSD